MTDEIPHCDHWIFGNITVTDGPDRDQPVEYERAILVSFKTVEEFRAALKYLSPVFEGGNGS